MPNAQSIPHHLQHSLDSHGLAIVDEDRVIWAHQSKHHPRHWTGQARTYNNAFILLFEGFAAANATIGAAAAYQARREYGISTTLAYVVFTTTTLIGITLAASIFPPLSETFGRKKPYVSCSLLLCASHGITAIPGLPAAVIGRLLAGFTSGVSFCVSPGALEDIYDSETMMWGMFAWNTASNVGLTLGPIASAYIAQSLGWRWVFYIAMLVSFAIFCMSLAFHESRPNLLLLRRLEKLKAETGNTNLRAENPDSSPTFRYFLQEAAIRPTKLLFTEPIVLICSFMNGVAFALIFALTEALTIVYSAFGFSDEATSLAFIPVLLGVLLSTVNRFYDQHQMKTLRLEERISDLPELKVQSFAVSAPALAAGLWLFAWTIPPLVSDVSWIVSMIGLVAVGYAANDFDTVLCGYLVDSYTTYANSALGGLGLLRGLLMVGFASFTHPFYINLGSNIATTVLAAGATVFCICPFILLRYGRTLRERSSFARYSTAMAQMNMSGPGEVLLPVSSDGVGKDGVDAVMVGGDEMVSVVSTPVSATRTTALDQL
ncbi:hypothetical protein LTR50_002890 [Elasticomyces elasticus]|nr:hypothetical protein LTR50_002890 [Elasticomyces elasticus]